MSYELRTKVERATRNLPTQELGNTKYKTELQYQRHYEKKGIHYNARCIKLSLARNSSFFKEWSSWFVTQLIYVCNYYNQVIGP